MHGGVGWPCNTPARDGRLGGNGSVLFFEDISPIIVMIGPHVVTSSRKELHAQRVLSCLTAHRVPDGEERVRADQNPVLGRRAPDQPVPQPERVEDLRTYRM